MIDLFLMMYLISVERVVLLKMKVYFLMILLVNFLLNYVLLLLNDIFCLELEDVLCSSCSLFLEDLKLYLEVVAF